MEGPTLRTNIASARVLAVNGRGPVERADRVAAEEPMEIRVGGPLQEPGPVAVTMRTPGGDFELAVGFLFTEGLVSGRDEIVRVAYCELPDEEQHFNVVTVRLSGEFDHESVRRNFYSTSSCGICGKASLDDVAVRCLPVGPGPIVEKDVLASFPATLGAAQRVFEETGGLHAAGLFEADGRLAFVREDVGRHNAVDKVIGEALLAGKLPLSEQILLVSGRVSFEIVQKAAVAGVPIVAAVSAPSSLALEAAERFGMTVAGFVRDDRFNIYSHPERVAF